MTITDAFWLLILVAGTYAFLMFIYRGKKYGYAALSVRTHELLESGVAEVWILCSNKGVDNSNASLNYIPGRTSIWTFLNTGFLSYIKDQQLIIEAPWWNNMRILHSFSPSAAQIAYSSIRYNLKTYPALNINSQSYAVVGENVQNIGDLKNLLAMNYPDASTSSLLNKFSKALFDGGFSIRAG